MFNLMRKKKRGPQPNRTAKDTLIIIGNGFDIWQDLDTGYSEFQKYYLAHRDEIMRRLWIRKKVIQYEDGRKISISDVELIYGDPFHPEELDNEFWNTFETSLDKLDAERINLFFGKDRRGLRAMDRSIRNANRILREAFCSWIATITIDPKDAGYQFGDNCLFINFNYTDTLHKRFGVQEPDAFHIHGKASDKESIIVGHSTHPQEPEGFLYQLGGRFRGLYFVERILYETDKHVRDNIDLLCLFLGIHGVRAEEIRHVYVLGHSMGPPDLEYFAFLASATTVHDPEEAQAENTQENDDLDPLDELHMRLQYAIQRGGYGVEDSQIDAEQRDAVARRYEQEQQERNRAFEKEMLKVFKVKKQDAPIEAPITAPRTEDAVWHVSYYSDDDKRWAEHVMKELGCKDFHLYPSIDECLKSFKL